MTARLVRALRRGGVTTEIRPDIWGVWRARDRRFRMIGTLVGGEVELMKLSEHLKAADDRCRMVWVWNEDAKPRSPLAVDYVAAHPLLNLLILKCHSPTLRRTFSHVAKSFRGDVALAARNKQCQCDQSVGIVADACLRLSRIRDALSKVDHAFLSALVLNETSKSDLTKAYDLRPDAIETKAMSVLRILAQVYN